jgi:hypothetical protein
MNEPRRLSRSGGISQRLLDSASLDKPSAASRRHATNLAATASSFARSSSGATNNIPLRRANPAATLATWMIVGAAASVTLGLVGSKLFEVSPAPRAAAPMLPTPAPRAAANSPDISPEPAVAPVPTLAPTLPSAPSAPGANEAGETEAAMALRIQTLTHSGKTAEARALAKEFERKYPGHPLPQELRLNTAP